MNPDEVLLEFKKMIDCAFRIGQDRERSFERFCIPAGMIQITAKDDQDLHPCFDKLVIQAPQLGDMRAAL